CVRTDGTAEATDGSANSKPIHTRIIITPPNWHASGHTFLVIIVSALTKDGVKVDSGVWELGLPISGPFRTFSDVGG
ncbi:MAG: hypothetical protein ACI855_000124, partial [Myxococcota bacterium]